MNITAVNALNVSFSCLLLLGLCVPLLGFSAWAQSQLKESTAGCLGEEETEEALVEATCKNKPQQGLLPYFLGSCFELRLLHVVLPELCCSCIVAMPVVCELAFPS